MFHHLQYKIQNIIKIFWRNLCEQGCKCARDLQAALKTGHGNQCTGSGTLSQITQVKAAQSSKKKPDVNVIWKLLCLLWTKAHLKWTENCSEVRKINI